MFVHENTHIEKENELDNVDVETYYKQQLNIGA